MMDYRTAYAAAKAALDKEYKTAESLVDRIKDSELKQEVSGLVKLAESGKGASKLKKIAKSYQIKWLAEEIDDLKKEIEETKEVINTLVYVILTDLDEDEDEIGSVYPINN